MAAFHPFLPLAAYGSFRPIAVIAKRRDMLDVTAKRRRDLSDLKLALTQFVTGADTSIAAANRLEVLLDEAYPDDELVQERVADLASYRPGGGKFLFDAPEMQRRLLQLQGYLNSLG